MNKYYQYMIQIAGITMEIKTNQRLQIPIKFESFITKAVEPEYKIQFSAVDKLPEIKGEIVFEELDYHVYQTNDETYFYTYADLPRDDSPYAISVFDRSTDTVQIDYLEKGAHCVSEMGSCFAHINFEELLLHKRRICLHASCVKTTVGGILFSGPSGIGKSTQADLWCKHRGANMINGDRPILSTSGSGWLAWGSPYAGSSRCHINKNCSIRAIVVLQKGNHCEIRKLTPIEAFHKMWSGLTVHSWDKTFVMLASDLVQQLIQDIPVYEMICTKDEEAVTCLENELSKEVCT